MSKQSYFKQFRKKGNVYKSGEKETQNECIESVRKKNIYIEERESEKERERESKWQRKE